MMKFNRPVRSNMNLKSIRIAHALLLCAACTGALADASAGAVAVGPEAEILGPWARSAKDCQRPELVLQADAVLIQTDADGQGIAFRYLAVKYAPSEGGLLSVELGKLHPYAKTASKTALTFKPVSADLLDLMQMKRKVRFVRCQALGH